MRPFFFAQVNFFFLHANNQDLCVHFSMKERKSKKINYQNFVHSKKKLIGIRIKEIAAHPR